MEKLNEDRWIEDRSLNILIHKNRNTILSAKDCNVVQFILNVVLILPNIHKH